MAAIIDEHQQWVDVGGKPLVGGKIYIGTVNADPVANPITIYSDAAFTTGLLNPQTLDSNGRSTNKIYVPGTFSLQVNNFLGGQEYQNLFNGTAASGGGETLTLTNVAGNNAITGAASTTIVTYVDKQIFILTTIAVNSASITLNIDGIGAKAVVKNKDQALISGDFQEDQTIIVVYNAINDNFEWTNQNVSLDKIATGTVSDAASLDFLNLSAAFAAYELWFWNLVPASTGVTLQLRTDSDTGGGSFDAGASDYAFVTIRARSGGTIGFQGFSDTDSIILAGSAENMDNDAAKPISGTVSLVAPALSTGGFTQIASKIGFKGDSNRVSHDNCSGQRNSASTVGAFQMFFSSGNISTMEWALYGRRA